MPTEFYLTIDAANASGNRGKFHGFRWAGARRVTACSGLVVADSSATDAAEVVEKRRCRAGGCRQQWETVLRDFGVQ